MAFARDDKAQEMPSRQILFMDLDPALIDEVKQGSHQRENHRHSCWTAWLCPDSRVEYNDCYATKHILFLPEINKVFSHRRFARVLVNLLHCAVHPLSRQRTASMRVKSHNPVFMLHRTRGSVIETFRSVHGVLAKPSDNYQSSHLTSSQ